MLKAPIYFGLIFNENFTFLVRGFNNEKKFIWKETF